MNGFYLFPIPANKVIVDKTLQTLVREGSEAFKGLRRCWLLVVRNLCKSPVWPSSCSELLCEALLFLFKLLPQILFLPGQRFVQLFLQFCSGQGVDVSFSSQTPHVCNPADKMTFIRHDLLKPPDFCGAVVRQLLLLEAAGILHDCFQFFLSISSCAVWCRRLREVTCLFCFVSSSSRSLICLPETSFFSSKLLRAATWLHRLLIARSFSFILSSEGLWLCALQLLLLLMHTSWYRPFFWCHSTRAKTLAGVLTSSEMWVTTTNCFELALEYCCNTGSITNFLCKHIIINMSFSLETEVYSIKKYT